MVIIEEQTMTITFSYTTRELEEPIECDTIEYSIRQYFKNYLKKNEIIGIRVTPHNHSTRRT